MENENDDASVKNDAIPPVQDGLIEKIFNFILNEYEPCNETDCGNVELMTTEEIFNRLQEFHRGDYTSEQISRFLHDKGFTFINSGKLRLEWVLKPQTQ